MCKYKNIPFYYKTFSIFLSNVAKIITVIKKKNDIEWIKK